MPSYYNPYPNYNPQPVMSQSFSPAPMPQLRPMEWVDGEVGAMAYQMPQGLQPGQAIALWDSQNQRVYLKSWNQMGMANKIQRLDYQIVEEPVANLPQGQSGSSGYSQSSDQYATKDEIAALRDEIRNLSGMIRNQNGSNNSNGGGNRGGNK